MLINKENIEKPEKRFNEMSAQELQSLSQAYFSQEKRDFVSKFTKEQVIIIERIEYELVVVDLM